MHGVGAAIPIHGETNVLARDGSIVLGTIVPAFGFCCPPPNHGRTHCATSGGRQGPRDCSLARFYGLLVPFGAARHSKVDRGGPSGCGRVLLLAQFGWWPQELAVPLLGDDSLRVRLSYYGVTITHVSATIAQWGASIA